MPAKGMADANDWRCKVCSEVVCDLENVPRVVVPARGIAEDGLVEEPRLALMSSICGQDGVNPHPASFELSIQVVKVRLIELLLGDQVPLQQLRTWFGRPTLWKALA